ncbi:MAG TPA: (d)CMP kinase [Candidatus Marinimicrobia bacterium]|jgi:cytidylate kinase|nr:(d)CMP kinase [Candidatus Neomarinimicrobiota bacterium]HIB03928.1 (d)CMP kinase [Candidatus Neomarinimicrobiota bacterium]HIB70347.1 (d)CMP kinase [Candidatus Neomarinimicrobiota bacterium]HIN61223.1 (d)CMP kinase [Candidatus Neomarinimicrobiota bacterium]HIO35908.1 (d)CMP kinase [Candidatus Neomarinimicrobiota bacterium]
MIVAIDGTAGSGKSTTAKGVAEKLGFLYLDTGAMYRAATAAVLSASIDSDDESAVSDCVETIEIDFDESGRLIFLNGMDVSQTIRGREVTQNVSAVSAYPRVRKRMVAMQREIAGYRDFVVEGRDIGTVVFPNADFKFFIVASIEERAKRRQKDLAGLGIEQTVNDIVKNLKRRDALDSSREVSPLTKSEDAVEVDTTSMTIEQQIDLIVTHVRDRSIKKETQSTSE